MTPTISLFFSFCFLLFFNTHALNITRILNQYPEFAAFNDYLTRTGVAFEINSRSGRSVSVTTLFQNTGSAVGGEGYLNVTVLSSGTIAFGSAVLGSPLNAKFIKPNNSPTQSPMNSWPPSTAPMAARAPSPRKVLAPPPVTVNSQPPSPFISEPPSSESPGPIAPAHTPISIFDALPIPPSGGTTKSSACRIHWFKVTAMAIIVATTFVVL